MSVNHNEKRICIPNMPLSLVRGKVKVGEPVTWRLRARYLNNAVVGGEKKTIDTDPSVRLPDGDLLTENGQRVGRRVKPEYLARALQFAASRGIVVSGQ